MITGRTKIFYMIAHPIDHVRSPEVFNPLFEQRGIDAVMVPVHYKPEDFEMHWESLRHTPNLAGFMVSVPHKEAAWRLSDRREESADFVSAANAVRRDEDGKFVCANFDGPGFMTGVLRSPEEAKGKHAFLVGAGGAGASIGFSLAEAGVARLGITDIDNEKAQSLASRISSRFPKAEVAAVPNDPKGYDLLINATPCGLHPDTDPLPFDIERVKGDAIVADIVMKPKVTPLLKLAQERGCDIRYGAGMLDAQVELAMRFFALTS
jgi:shikimate dehydrogenase